MIIPTKYDGYRAGVRLYQGGMFGGGGGGGGGGVAAPPPPPPPPWANLGVNTERGYNTLLASRAQPLDKTANAYNDLLGQGFNNQQIRSSADTVIGKQGDEYWNQMVQGAALQSNTGRPLAGSAQFYQPIQQQKYDNYTNPLTAFNVSNYGTNPGMSKSMQEAIAPGGMGAGEYYRNLREYGTPKSLIRGEDPNGNGVSLSNLMQDMRRYNISAQDLQNASYYTPSNYQQSVPQAENPFDPYKNKYATPFSYQQPGYGSSQAIVGRSSQVRGTPNVVATKAEGGIASLLDNFK
jgi:hypothetical protein